ncbi:MAG: EAL domain-containing protein [Cyanobacteria bacterium P01_H01_bin.58]
MRLSLQLYAKIKPFVVGCAQAFPFSGRSILIASLMAATLVTGIKKVGSLQRFELFIFDYLVRLQPALEQDPRLVIVGITESDIQQYGWPLSDQTLATLIESIQAYSPQVIGLDIYRKTHHPPGRDSLEKELAAANLIAITNVGSSTQAGEVPPPDTVPWERVGFNNLTVDPDGVVRRSLLFVDHPEKPYYSFALRVALAALEESAQTFQHDDQALSINGHPIKRLQEQSGGYQTIDNRGFQTLLRYRSRYSPVAQLSIDEVLKGEFDPTKLTNKIVLIGSTAPSLKDEFFTPYSASDNNRFTLSGVVVHAQMISQLLDIADSQLAQYQFLPQLGEFIWLLGWTVITSVLAWYVRRPEILLASGIGVLLLLCGVGWLGLTQLVWLPIFEPLLGVLMAAGIVVAQKSIYRSTHDDLTHLPGRGIFLLHVQRALNTQSPKPVIIAFLDIDRFQIINKSLGHYTGDFVLITIAKRLKKVLGEHAQVARIGGDEFALLFYKQSQKSVKRLLDEMRLVLASPIALGKRRLSITASVGLAVTQTKYRQAPEDLLRDAHTAMYRAKALDEAQYQVFSNDMREEAVARLDLESDLVKALERDEFSLFYQPIVNLQTEKIEGFEALLRWYQSERGMISPYDFIPIVEETGMIISLGEWVLKAACQQTKLWIERFPKLPLKMSINLSRRQFDQPNLCERIETMLSELQLPGNYIQLEITESMIMRNVETAYTLMMELKALGIQLAIDDFGTGYSSLSYLHRFPTDTLKIDRSFVSGMKDSSEDFEIVQTIIGLGHKLNMNLVAEGIANREELVLLREANCQCGQGYYFAKPLPAEAATDLLRKQVTKSQTTS